MCNQNIGSNKFDLNLSTTLSSYDCHLADCYLADCHLTDFHMAHCHLADCHLAYCQLGSYHFQTCFMTKFNITIIWPNDLTGCHLASCHSAECCCVNSSQRPSQVVRVVQRTFTKGATTFRATTLRLTTLNETIYIKFLTGHSVCQCIL
jgi:hypothetical protein